MNNKILLSDVAKAANCSIAQASRAINGKPDVAPKIREQVMKAALKFNYRNTANRHVPNIAILKYSKHLFYYSQIISTLEKELRKVGWKWQIIDEYNVRSINEFFHNGVLSLCSSELIAKEFPYLMNIPLVVINNYGIATENICSVDPDSYEESHLVLEHLKSLGHRKIARIKETCFRRSSRYVIRGDKEFIEAAKTLKLENFVENFNYTEKSELTAVVKTILDQGFSAIFMIHQHLAVAISSILHSLRVKVPEDISLITYEYPDVTENLYPPHTTLDFDYQKISSMAVKMLKKRIHGERVPVSQKCPVKLNVRASTAPLL